MVLSVAEGQRCVYCVFLCCFTTLTYQQEYSLRVITASLDCTLSLFPPSLFWRLPVLFACVRAMSAFADVRWACALNTGGCWNRVGAAGLVLAYPCVYPSRVLPA
ncbi:hypothetical protein BDR03DRAFT_146756 [Suillus americanus]|nr:hypothetical protein BDR03DRAFT_146756 [Suillus americanus]